MNLHLVSDLHDNYERFIKKVRESKIVWGLKSENGWANCDSNEFDCQVLLFWSEQAYAKRHAKAEWANYQPAEIELKSFIDNWLNGMHKDGLLAGVNFNADLAGLEVAPLS
ncbi:DUF2750 domain-containing protein [Deefgea piscis]|uniref:DUF2750 domain-containing protein n=1 Tax=Deefgea piscis TaxID=2739061 RepID=UPI001C815AC0|nr:DUF2750 domain-containing protein [Deefgea piscis]QZA82274.1 DUF2750 domain-containing protein [Deefgea piscis]